LGWVILPFILVHSMIGHKEIRFLFPMVGLLPVVIVQAIELVRIRWSPSLLDNRVWRITAKAFVAVYAVFLGVIIFKPADAQISPVQKPFTMSISSPSPSTISAKTPISE
jgi:phosphatidylinositol glycan class B